MNTRIDIWRGRAHDERGASAIIVGICVIMLFGFAAFAVDAGNAWQNRRHVIVASDAAALAAAQEYALGGNGCGGTDDAFVAVNDSKASVVSCTPGNLSSTSGYVTVKAQTPNEFVFAGIIGVEGGNVSSTTTARYEVPQSVIGLRPFGLCTSIAALMRSSGDTEKVYYDKATQLVSNALIDCPENPSGNWAVIDLNDDGSNGGGQQGNNSTKTLGEWIRYGYEGSVAPGDMAGDPGIPAASVADDLAYILSTSGNEKPFCLPVYEATNGQGENATYAVTGFATITLWGYNVTGDPAGRYLELRVEESGLCEAGNISGSPSVDFGSRVVRICAVDFADDLSKC